jgi:hypothetical protein
MLDNNQQVTQSILIEKLLFDMATVWFLQKS